MDYDERVTALRKAFTPARPVQNQDLFAGRRSQLLQILDTLDSPGEHAAIFGERGVGKTSLASVSEIASSISGQFPLRLNCQADDAGSDIWRRVGETVSRRLRVEEAQGNEIADLTGVAPGAVAILTSPAPSSHDVLTALEILSQARPVVVFLDEFDRLGESVVHASLVDLMKTVADLGLDITFVVVGVASTVDGLIDEHESIGRGLNEIEMPRMTVPELREILTRGYGTAEMVATDDAAETIARLSRGLPHYTHLLGLHAGISAAAGDEPQRVTSEHLMEAIPKAVSRAQQHVSRLYHDATHSTQANIFKEVMLGAALTKTDERGYFAPGDLRGPLSRVLGRSIEIPAYARHLNQFAGERGPAMQKSGQRNRPRYRFSEPLLVPFIAMRGVSDGLITLDELREALM